jgi:adenylate kinase
MGIAGAGKGTQAQLLVEQHGFHLLTMGDIVRQNVSEEQKGRMLKGELLGDDEVISILEKVLATIPADEECVLDGFPRTIPQAEWLVGQASRFHLRGAFHLVASREAVKARLLGRARADDQEAAIEKRFDEYERATKPLLDWLSKHGVKVIDINAERTVEEINADINQQLEKL